MALASLTRLALMTTHVASALPHNSAIVTGQGMGLMDEKPNMPHDPNTISSCTWWWDNDGSISCSDMPAEWGISLENFLKWNPSITSSCGNYVTGRSYCVEIAADSHPTTTNGSPPDSTGTPGNGIETPLPIQPGMVNNCDKFYFVKQGDTCDAITRAYGVSFMQLMQWNPNINVDCTGLWANVNVCVGTIGLQPAPPLTTTKPPITTTRSGNGITTPVPTQPGMVTDCDRFYHVQSGNTCDTVTRAAGITLNQLIQWNPSINTDCTGLWANVWVCTRTIGFVPPPTPTTTRPPTTTTKPGNGITTPLPTQPGMVSNCNRFHKVSSGDTCANIGARNGITAARIAQWNTGVGGPACTGLWANVHVCTRTIGYVSATENFCPNPEDPHLHWGNNKQGALNAITQWCDGNSATDGSGVFSMGQAKYACYKAPNGNHKFILRARNDFGVSTSLSVAKCGELLRSQVNKCTRGGHGKHEGWWFSIAVLKGQC